MLYDQSLESRKERKNDKIGSLFFRLLKYRVRLLWSGCIEVCMKDGFLVPDRVRGNLDALARHNECLVHGIERVLRTHNRRRP